MGESNQARSLKYYLWIKGAANQWYVCRSSTCPEEGFESYHYKEHRWRDRSDYYDRHEHKFMDEHREIDDETAFKCIFGGPEFCLKKQKELREETKEQWFAV